MWIREVEEITCCCAELEVVFVESGAALLGEGKAAVRGTEIDQRSLLVLEIEFTGGWVSFDICLPLPLFQPLLDLLDLLQDPRDRRISCFFQPFQSLQGHC